MGRNLITNPGFENGDTAWTKNDPLVASVVENATNARTGTWIGSISAIRYPTPFDPFIHGKLSQAISTSKGVQYQFSAWVRSSGTVSGRGKVRLLADGVEIASYSTSDGQWYHLTGTFIAANDTTTVAIEALESGTTSGTWYVDDTDCSIYTVWTKRSLPEDSVPSIPSECTAFADEAQGWEVKAEQLGNIVTISGERPQDADFETFGEAWRRYGMQVSPSNPFIFQFLDGHHYPYDAVARGKAQDVPIVVGTHPGGVVVRGTGRSWLWTPADWANVGVSLPHPQYEFGGCVLVDGGRVFFKAMHLGITGSAGDDAMRRDDVSYVREVLGFSSNDYTQSYCKVREPSTSHGWNACGSGSAGTIVTMGNVNLDTAVFLSDCTIANEWDCLEEHGWQWTSFKDKPQAAPNAIVKVVHDCRVILRTGFASQETTARYNLTTSADTIHTNGPNVKTWVRDTRFEGDCCGALEWSGNFAATNVGPIGPSQAYFERVSVLIKSPFMGGGQARIMFLGMSGATADSYTVLDDVSVTVSSEGLRWYHDNNVVPFEQPNSAVVGGIISLGPTDHASPHNLAYYVVGGTFDIDLTYLDWFYGVTNWGPGGGWGLWRAFSIADLGWDPDGSLPYDGSNLAIHLYDPAIMVHGRSEDTQWYEETFNQTTGGVIRRH